jgi:hypothetical protein
MNAGLASDPRQERTHGPPSGQGGSSRWGRAIALLGPLLLYLALIFALSSQSRPLPFIPGRFLSHDTVLHAMEYGLLGALLLRALAGMGLRAGRALVLAAAIASLYGATDEWHQSFVPNRSCDPKDWAADAIGGSVGAALMAVLLRRKSPRASIVT